MIELIYTTFIEPHFCTVHKRDLMEFEKLILTYE